VQLLGSGGGLEVRLDAGNGKGKGLFATRDIKMGEVVLTERPLVSRLRNGCQADSRCASARASRAHNTGCPRAAPAQAGTQDLDSKLEVTTCAHCYTAVGEWALLVRARLQVLTAVVLLARIACVPAGLVCSSPHAPLAGTVEQAFGGKICMLINELSEASEADDLQEIQARVDKVCVCVEGGGWLLLLLCCYSSAARSFTLPCRTAGSWRAPASATPATTARDPRC
jgi:hypothetical protein